MFTLLSLALLAKGALALVAIKAALATPLAVKIVGLVLGSAGSLAVGTPAPNFQRKNSGTLRYYFGSLVSGGTLAYNARAALVGGATEVVLCCLGADSDLNYDGDAQAFGETPGYAAITGLTGSLFASHNLTAKVAVSTGYKIPPNPNTGLPTFGVQGAETLYSPAGARIPAGTKVRAWFQAGGLTQAGSTVSDEQPAVIVQVEVTQNTIVKSTVDGPDTVGPTWLSCIRVAIKNIANSATSAAGTLFVDLEQSHIDIPCPNSQVTPWSNTIPG